jgi:hypothetical protein
VTTLKGSTTDRPSLQVAKDLGDWPNILPRAFPRLSAAHGASSNPSGA